MIINNFLSKFQRIVVGYKELILLALYPLEAFYFSLKSCSSRGIKLSIILALPFIH